MKAGENDAHNLALFFTTMFITEYDVDNKI